MLPTINLGALKLPSYGLLVLLGAIAFTVITIVLLEKVEKTPREATNKILIISIFGFIFLYAFAFITDAFFHSIEEGKIVFGGIAWLGGVLGAFPMMLLMLHRYCPDIKGRALEYFNLLIPGITVAHGFGRIGCFLAGCCYGKVTESIFGVSFPEGSNAAETYPALDGGSLPVLPTQLYEALFEFILFALMMILYKRFKNHLLEAYCFTYGVFRFILEFWRGDDRGATGFAFSPSQLMSVVLVIYGIMIVLYHKGIIFKKLKSRMKEYADSPRTSGAKSSLTYADKLAELKKMLADELITQNEYESLRTEILEKFTDFKAN